MIKIAGTKSNDKINFKEFVDFFYKVDWVANFEREDKFRRCFNQVIAHNTLRPYLITVEAAATETTLTISKTSSRGRRNNILLFHHIIYKKKRTIELQSSNFGKSDLQEEKAKILTIKRSVILSARETETVKFLLSVSMESSLQSVTSDNLRLLSKIRHQLARVPSSPNQS